MANYKNLTNERETAAYTNTDYILKSLVESMDVIEQEETAVIIEPQERIYSFFSRVNALYSKTHYYIDSEFKIDGKIINVATELNNIKNRLYNKQFVTDIKKYNNNPNSNDTNLIKEYNIIISKTCAIYRHMTYEFSRKGMFFTIYKEDKRAGVVK